MLTCPEPFTVNLDPNEMARVISWKEATFDSERDDPIKQVYKSKVPGTNLGAGVHFISYVATTESGQSAKCNFRVVVKREYSRNLVFVCLN